MLNLNTTEGVILDVPPKWQEWLDTSQVVVSVVGKYISSQAFLFTVYIDIRTTSVLVIFRLPQTPSYMPNALNTVKCIYTNYGRDPVYTPKFNTQLLAMIANPADQSSTL